ncbi:class II aldolase/adducin family protein [Hyaloraphidium curvatum]|nr:class II aldolase/adducin family protein [Hyaloraphidium curvatum]
MKKHGGHLPEAARKKANPGYVSRSATDQATLLKEQLQYPWDEPARFFPTVEDKRLHIKQRLAAGLRVLGHAGMDVGVAGHMSARDPEFTDCFWINPFALHFTDITVGSLCLLNQSGEVIHGSRPINSAGFAIHAGIYASLERVNAIVHTHSMYGKTLSAQGRTIDPISQDACAFYERQRLHNQYDGVVLDSNEGKQIAKTLGKDCNLAILQNHGLLTVGETVDEMVWWFMSAENCAQSQILAEAGGSTIKLDHHTACVTREVVGSRFAGWLNFQPYFHNLLKREADFLDEEEIDPADPKFIPNARLTVGKDGKIRRNILEEQEQILAKVRSVL